MINKHISSNWLIFIALIPILAWVLTIIPEPFRVDGYLINETHWLSFFGSYFGATISVLITLYVMYKTLNQNSNALDKTLKQNQINHRELTELQNETNDRNEKLNLENRNLNELLNRQQQQMQINQTKYSQEQINIQNLRNILYENNCLIDYQRLAKVSQYIKLGNINYAMEHLLSISRECEIQGAKSDLYLCVGDDSKTSEEERNYLKIVKKTTYYIRI